MDIEEDSEEPAKLEAEVSKEEIRVQNLMIKRVFIGLEIFVLIIISVAFLVNSDQKFNYQGVDFKIVKEGKLIFYNTAFPVKNPITGEHIADYNFYLRNDPRKLEKVPFEGGVVLKENIVINATKEFNCEGDEIIAIANLVQVFNQFGAKTIKDPEAGCDSKGRYTFIQIRGEEGEATSIESFGPPESSCYNFYVNNCEILEVTEKFIVDLFVEAKKEKV